MKRTQAWLIWTFGAALTTLLIRHPLYLVVIALGAWLTLSVHELHGAPSRGWRILLLWGTLAAALFAAYQTTMAGPGGRVLVRLPRSVPLVGDSVTAQGLARGLTDGLQLWTLLVVYVAANAAISPVAFLDTIPVTLAQAARPFVVAALFVPELAAVLDTRAPLIGVGLGAARGVVAGLGRPLRLLVGAYKRSAALVDRRVLRSISRGDHYLKRTQVRNYRLQTVLGMLWLANGFLFRDRWPELLWLRTGMAVVAGLLLIDLARRLVVGRVAAGRLAADRPSRSDAAVAILSAAPTLTIIAVRLLSAHALRYTPATGGGLLPGFHGWIGVALALLAAPALVALFGQRERSTDDSLASEPQVT